MILVCLTLLPYAMALDGVVKQGDSYDIRVTVAANGTIDSVTANITISDPEGNVLVAFQEMQKNVESQDFNFTLNETNTTEIGFYDCTVYAFSTIADNTIFSCAFEVNPSGKQYIPEISGPLIFGAILTMMFASVMLMFLGIHIDLFPMKVFLIIMSGIIAILNIGFVAGSFQEFYSPESALSGAFGSLYIAFILLITAASVFLIIWVVLTGFSIYNTRRGFFVEA